MFLGCNILSSFPEISEWNTSKVNNMKGMFWKCMRIVSLPDISKWKTSKVNNMQNIFFLDANY